MGCMEGPDRLRLIVFLDEMGGEERMDAVRALCSVGSDRIKEALVKSLGFELPNVDLKLAMAGERDWRRGMIVSAVRRRLAAFKEVEGLPKKPLYIAVFKTFETFGSYLFLFQMKN